MPGRIPPGSGKRASPNWFSEKYLPLAILSPNKTLVLELARCEFLSRRENDKKRNVSRFDQLTFFLKLTMCLRRK